MWFRGAAHIGYSLRNYHLFVDSVTRLFFGDAESLEYRSTSDNNENRGNLQESGINGYLVYSVACTTKGTRWFSPKVAIYKRLSPDQEELHWPMDELVKDISYDYAASAIVRDIARCIPGVDSEDIWIDIFEGVKGVSDGREGSFFCVLHGSDISFGGTLDDALENLLEVDADSVSDALFEQYAAPAG